MMIFQRSSIFEFDPNHPSCHCSVIQELPNHELMTIWYAGKAEAHKTVGIKASWKPIQESNWTEPTLIHKSPGIPDGNAIIIWYQNRLHLYFNTIHFPLVPWSHTKVNHKVSDDYGRTWAEQEVIVNDLGFTVRNKPLVLNNRLIIPVGRERIIKDWSHCLITENGKDYHLSNPIYLPKGGNIQPTLIQLTNGQLLAYLRTNQNHIYQTVSDDIGETWSSPQPLNLYNPNSALDMVRINKDALILAWNNNPRKGGMMQSRRCLNIGYSPDGGIHWPIIKEIERDDKNGQFAYPSLIQGSDGLFHMTYTNRRINIRYVKFDLEWLLSEK